MSTTESFAGSPVDGPRDVLQSQLDLSLTSWLEKLKTAGEANEAHAVDHPLLYLFAMSVPNGAKETLSSRRA